MMKILLTGRNGQVGWELAGLLGDHDLVALDRESLDLTDLAAVRQMVHDVQPDLIVNAAAYTLVDQAESEPQFAHQVNALGPAAMAEAAGEVGAAVIHYSTDYVFDGTATSPYQPHDPPCPIGAYGRSKLAGEQAVMQSGIPAIILRTSWVYGLRGRNFLLTMLRLAESRNELRVVDDQRGAPTWSRTIATATKQIIDHALSGESGARHFAGREGLYHLTAKGVTTWCEFARAIFRLSDNSSAPTVHAISTAEYPTPARRPPYSVLDSSATERTFAIHLPHWEDALQQAIHAHRSNVG